MKKVMLLCLMMVLAAASFSQSEKYMKVMQEKVPAVDTTRSVDGLKDLSALFERVADAEKTQWLPYYYAALTQINAAYIMMSATPGGMNGGMASKLDPIADKTEELLNKAEALSKDNSEIYVIRKMIASIHMMGDPMSRYMTYGPQAQQALETARKLNPENPRVYLLMAEDKFFTPEQFGGSKEEGKKLFEESIRKYDAFKPATPIDPIWGKPTAQYLPAQAK